MGAICGILGKRDPAVVAAMAAALAGRGKPEHETDGAAYCIAGTDPAGAGPCLVDGVPRDTDGNILSAGELRGRCAKPGDPEAWGLRGAFAAVAFTGERGGWLLLRDRLGRRPLYYYRDGDALLFASELKAILASGKARRRLNLQSVDRYLTLRCVPGPETIIQDVYQVPPGHALRFQGGQVTTVPFAPFRLDAREMPKEEAAALLRKHLKAAVDRHAAPQLLWSGGIDCAALAALKPELAPVFASIERAWQHESRPARESARRLGATLLTGHARRLTEETFGRVVRRLDEPMADASVFPLWLVFEAARQRGDRFMSGHGADELLGGYSRYLFLQKARGAQNMVPVNLVGGLLPALPPNAFVRRGSRYLASVHDSLRSHLSLVSVFDFEEREELYTDAMKAALYDHGSADSPIREHFTGDDLTQSLLSLDLSHFLPDLLLTKLDRLASGHGITLEFPYMDDALVDFVAGLSPKTKFGVRGKPLLRLAMKGLLPGRIRLRARRGFQIPRAGRLAGVIESVTRHVITPERVDAAGLFKWHFVEQIVRGASHNVYRRRQFWALLMFFAWYQQVMEEGG
jgi:asparagine synthase (glutamine-hydrolysing)